MLKHLKVESTIDKKQQRNLWRNEREREKKRRGKQRNERKRKETKVRMKHNIRRHSRSFESPNACKARPNVRYLSHKNDARTHTRTHTHIHLYIPKDKSPFISDKASTEREINDFRMPNSNIQLFLSGTYQSIYLGLQHATLCSKLIPGKLLKIQKRKWNLQLEKPSS